jgi:acyl carrier protein
MQDDILRQATQVVREVLEDDAIELKPNTVANQVAGWDSLTHVEIIVGIEKHFKIRFTSKEIQSFKNVGAMCEAIAAKRAP